MSRPSRRTNEERAEAKQARAYVEESRRRASAVVQQATVDRMNELRRQALERHNAQQQRHDRIRVVAIIPAIAIGSLIASAATYLGVSSLLALITR